MKTWKNASLMSLLLILCALAIPARADVTDQQREILALATQPQQLGGGGGGGITSATIPNRPRLDTEMKAREYLASGVLRTHYYFISVDSTLVQQGGGSVQENISAQLANKGQYRGRIVFYAVGGDVIVDVAHGIGQPIDGILPPAAGWVRTSVNVNAGGYDVDHKQTLYGYVYYSALPAGKQIVAKLDPMAMMRSFTAEELDVPSGQGVRMPQGSGNGYWNAWTNRYEFWIGPFQASDPWFQIYNLTTGVVFRTGRMPYLPDNPPVLPLESAVSFVLDPGLVAVEFGDQNWVRYEKQPLDGSRNIGESGLTEPCQTFMVDTGTQAMIIRARGLGAMRITVRADDETFIDSSVINRWGEAEVRLIPNWGQIYVTVTGYIPVAGEGFSIELEKMDQLPDQLIQLPDPTELNGRPPYLNL